MRSSASAAVAPSSSRIACACGSRVSTSRRRRSISRWPMSRRPCARRHRQENAASTASGTADMHIGTPLSPSATKVMLLGSGELGKEVIIALQRLGVETIAVDRYPNAPGHQVAHRAHVIDMTDGVALSALIALEKPDLVVPEIEAIATETLVALEEAGRITCIPTARAALLTMNREGIRRLAAEELGLPTSPYRFASSLEELEQACAAVGFPCVVKPVM